MERIKIELCPYCKSTNIGVGYQLGNGQLFADLYAYQTTGECSNNTEIKKYDYMDKDELKQNFSLDKRTFDKAFDYLLENN